MYRTSVLVIILSILSLSFGATLFPKSLRTTKGSASSTSLNSLQKVDQSGSQDTWSNYVEFYGSSTAYSGVFTFDASSVNAASVSSFNLDVSYKGPKSSRQVWQFEYFEPSSNSWILAGDNTDAPSWVWTTFSFCAPTSFSSLVASDKTVQVRLSSTTKRDDCDIDYLAITTSEEESAPVTSAPATNAPATAAPTSVPTTPATNAPATPAATTRPTSAPATPAATTRPTSAPATPAATTRPTTAPNTPAATTRPTSAPATPAATTRPTSAPTSAPATAAPTTKPTSAPVTSAPTTKPTSAPATSAPTPGGRICPAGSVWQPAPGTTWQWQLTGTIDQTLDVQMYDIDLFDVSAAVITQLHNKGRVVICYFSTQYEDWRSDASKFTSDILGNNLDDWPGERYVDIRSSKLRTIMTQRLDLAVSKGCDGVEPDNVDSYANSNGLGLKAADQLDYNRFLANEAHKRGLSIGLKNDLDQVSALVNSFDWALNEQCNEYSECNTLKPFTNAGKAVFGVEYKGTASKVCTDMVNSRFSWLMKSLSLGASGTQCCTFAPGGCAKAPYTCVNYSSKRSEVDEEQPIDIVEEVFVTVPAVEEVAVEQVMDSSATIASAATFVLVAAVALVL